MKLSCTSGGAWMESTWPLIPPPVFQLTANDVLLSAVTSLGAPLPSALPGMAKIDDAGVPLGLNTRASVRLLLASPEVSYQETMKRPSGIVLTWGSPGEAPEFKIPLLTDIWLPNVVPLLL